MTAEYPYELNPLADKAKLLDAYKGKKRSELPTPCFTVNRKTVEENCEKMLENAKKLKLSFRAHIKTHKTMECTILQLGKGENKTDRLIVSTVSEAWHVLPLVEQGQVKDILFSLPVVESRLGELAEMTARCPQLNLRLMLDNAEQLNILASFSEKNKVQKKWSVFVKVNMGSNRAGLVNESSELGQIIGDLANPASEIAKYVSLYGFYCHAGHSYGSRSLDQARSLLVDEIENANNACKKAVEINPSLQLVISVGATPTAHASSSTNKVLEELENLGKLYGEVELHAGNYPFCDLQQMGTNCVGIDSVSCRILADVVSAYPGRGDKSPGEQLINAGVIAISRETGPLPGFGNIVSPKGYGSWILGRLSQEHGILVPNSDDCKLIPLSTRVEIVPQHSCISAAAFPWYFVFDGDDENATVADVWVPFRGW